MIPAEHIEVLQKTETVLQQFASFMTGENSALVINNEQEYANAAQVIAAVKLHKKDVEASKKAVVEPLYKEYKDTLAEFTPVIDRIDQKISALESAGRGYRQRVEAEARRLQAIADQKAADERRKAEEKAAAERKKAEELREQGREDLAEKAELRADTADMKAAQTVAPIIQPAITPSFRGSFNTRKVWKAKISKVELLLEHFKAACPPNVKNEMQKWADAQARSSGGTASTIPGVEYYES